jgi:hypothetical protein
VPRRLVAPTGDAVEALAEAVADRDRVAARQAALDVEQAALDLQLQYRPAAEVDLGRFDAWLRQVLVDVESRDLGALLGDVATLEWIRDRVETALGRVELTRLDTLLKELRTNAGDEDYAAVSETVAELRDLLS